MIKYFSTNSCITFLDTSNGKTISFTSTNPQYEMAYKNKDNITSLDQLQQTMSADSTVYKDDDIELKVFNLFIEVNGKCTFCPNAAKMIRQQVNGLSREEIAISLEGIITFFKKAVALSKLDFFMRWIAFEDDFISMIGSNGNIYCRKTLSIKNLIYHEPFNLIDNGNNTTQISTTNYIANAAIEIDISDVNDLNSSVKDYKVIDVECCIIFEVGDVACTVCIDNELSKKLIDFSAKIIDKNIIISDVVSAFKDIIDDNDLNALNSIDKTTDMRIFNICAGLQYRKDKKENDTYGAQDY